VIPEPFILPGRLKALLFLGAAGVVAALVLPRLRQARRKAKASRRASQVSVAREEKWLQRVDVRPAQPGASKRAARVPARPQPVRNVRRQAARDTSP
jgi:type II secretory pathway pseudopilin PulG